MAEIRQAAITVAEMVIDDARRTFTAQTGESANCDPRFLTILRQTITEALETTLHASARASVDLVAEYLLK